LCSPCIKKMSSVHRLRVPECEERGKNGDWCPSGKIGVMEETKFEGMLDAHGMSPRSKDVSNECRPRGANGGSSSSTSGTAADSEGDNVRGNNAVHHTVDVFCRYINGSEVVVSDCVTLLDLKVKIAAMHGRYSPDVCILTPDHVECHEMGANPPARVHVVMRQEKYTPEMWISAALAHAQGDDRTGLHRMSEDLSLTASDIFGQALQRCGNDAPLFSLLVECRADVNIPDPHNGRRLLHNAIRQGDVAAVYSLLDAQADVNLPAHNGQRPLHWAINKGLDEVVHALVQAEADVNLSTACHQAPLLWAVIAGSCATCEILLDHDADVSSADISGDTALHLAALYGYPDITQVLINARANVNEKNSVECDPISAAFFECYKDMIKVTVTQASSQPELSTIDSQSFTCLVQSNDTSPGVRRTPYDMTGVSIESHNETTRTDDVHANLSSSRALVEEENAESRQKLGFLCGTKKRLCEECCPHDLTLTKRAVLDRENPKRSDDDVSPLLLHISITDEQGNNNHQPCSCSLSLEDSPLCGKCDGIDTDVSVSSVILSPAHAARQVRYRETIKRLITAGADVNSAKDGKTLLAQASHFGHTDLMILLLNHHADVNKTNHTGQTPLHFACYTDDEKVFELLIAAYVDINARDENGQTALDVARDELRDEKVLQMLTNAGAKIRRKNSTGGYRFK